MNLLVLVFASKFVFTWVIAVACVFVLELVLALLLALVLASLVKTRL